MSRPLPPVEEDPEAVALGGLGGDARAPLRLRRWLVELAAVVGLALGLSVLLAWLLGAFAPERPARAPAAAARGPLAAGRLVFIDRWGNAAGIVRIRGHEYAVVISAGGGVGLVHAADCGADSR